MTLAIVVISLLFIASSALSFWLWRERASLSGRLEGLDDLDAEKRKVTGEIAEMRRMFENAKAKFNGDKARCDAEISTIQKQLAARQAELRVLDEEAEIQSFGFYKPHYDFASSSAYQARLDAVRAEQKKMVKDKTAAVCSTEWQVNGSVVEGRKQINQALKLMLRAFNGECDAAVAKVKYNNIHVMESRIEKAYGAINALASVQQCRIAPHYLDLKMQELRLSHEWAEKIQTEKEEQRRIREQMREEEQAQRELERAREEAEKEAQRAQEVLVKARALAAEAEGPQLQKLNAQIVELERRLVEAERNRERALSRAQMTKSGHVYVISNIGSFGENVFKIGMTRRLDPLDRVRELGDASVPFLFDVHAVIFTEDAPALEAALHRAFAHKRVNLINERKEFFRVPMSEIERVVTANHGKFEWVRDAEAREYRETLAKSQASNRAVSS